MSICRSINAFDRWRSDGQPLVLATVIDTAGSTYSKTGRRMVLTGEGEYEGLVSGGCLEGDLAEHARAVLNSGEARTVTYDMRDEADELWGLGAGCKGLIRLLLQKLDAEHQYEPFTSIAGRLTHGPRADSVTVITSDDPALLPENVRGRFAGDGEARATADYVAGMTDRFAAEEHRRLGSPG